MFGIIKIPRADRNLNKNNVVYELHFLSSDVLKNKEYDIK